MVFASLTGSALVLPFFAVNRRIKENSLYLLLPEIIFAIC